MRAPHRLSAISLAVLLVGCPTGDDDDSAPPAEPPPEFVEGEVALTDAATGERVEGAAVAFEDTEELSDANGRARLTVPSQAPFELVVSKDGYADHHLAGLAGVDNFQFQTLLSDRATTDAVFGSLGLTADPAKGIVVVSLDTIALQAAMGASATLDAASDTPFVFVDNAPTEGTELVFGAASFITFPNVDPGTVEVSITPPDGDVCLNFPALVSGEDRRSFEVVADAVTVTTFICQ